jgi:hypothetical protein
VVSILTGIIDAAKGQTVTQLTLLILFCTCNDLMLCEFEENNAVAV